ncbi:hypothetical protein QNK12_09860 [Neobacillus cucumis]|nr:hypothetical protein QNK12_09860 [Neobacillus cucumis]
MNKYCVNFHFSDKDYLTILAKAESGEHIFDYFTKVNSEGFKWINISSKGVDRKLGLESTTINFDKVLYYTIEKYKEELYEKHKEEDFFTLNAE